MQPIYADFLRISYTTDHPRVSRYGSHANKMMSNDDTDDCDGFFFDRLF